MSNSVARFLYRFTTRQKAKKRLARSRSYQPKIEFLEERLVPARVEKVIAEGATLPFSASAGQIVQVITRIEAFKPQDILLGAVLLESAPGVSWGGGKGGRYHTVDTTRDLAYLDNYVATSSFPTTSRPEVPFDGSPFTMTLDKSTVTGLPLPIRGKITVNTGDDIQKFATKFTSASSATFPLSTSSSFKIQTEGGLNTPNFSLKAGSTLPAGLTLKDNKDGTATITGTPTAAAGTTHVIIVASSPTDPRVPRDNVEQDLAITVGVVHNTLVSGQVFEDLNRNGVWDKAMERLLKGAKVDLIQNGAHQVVTTDDLGRYKFTVQPGVFQVQQVLDAPAIQTTPTDPKGFTRTATQTTLSMSLPLFGQFTGNDIAITAASRNDDLKTTVSYASSGKATNYQIALYRSANATFDATDVLLSGIATVSTPAGVSSGQVDISFKTKFVHDPARPYLLAVADPSRLVVERVETNNSLFVTHMVSLDPLQVTGAFAFNPKLDRWESKAGETIQVGFKPPDGGGFNPLAVIKGSVWYTDKQIDSTGNIAGWHLGSPVPLMTGHWAIEVKTATAAVLSTTSSAFPIAGALFVFTKIKFVNPGDAATEDSYLECHGELPAPATFGLFKLSFQDKNLISIGPSTRTISAKIELPKVEVKLFGDRLKATVESMSATWLPETDIHKGNPEKGAFQIRGKLTIQPKDSEAKASLEFVDDELAGDQNFIEFGPLGLFFKGTAKVENLVVWKDVLEIKKGSVFYDSAKGEVRVDGEIVIKPITDKTLIFGGGWQQWEFNYVAIGMDGIDKLIWPAGLVYLQKVVLAVDNMASTDTDALEGAITVGFTQGPKIIIDANEFLGIEESTEVALTALEATGKLSKEHLGGVGEFKILHENLLKLKGAVDWKWGDSLFDPSDDIITVKGTLSALAETITGAANATFDKRGLTALGSLHGTLKLPSFRGIEFQPIADASVQAYAQYRSDDDPTNDFAVFSGEVDLPVLGRKTIALRIHFNDLSTEVLYGMAGVDSTDPEPAASPTAKVGPRAAIGPKAATVLGPDEFSIAAGTKQLLVTAAWANHSNNVQVELMRPDGTVMTEADFDGTNAAIQPFFSGTTSRAVALLNPVAGVWKVRLASPDDLGEASFTAYREKQDPSIEVTSAKTVRDAVTINYLAGAPDTPGARVSLFYDTDGTGFDGLPITDNLPVTGASASYIWNSAHVRDGSYRIYAMITDGEGTFRFDYLDAPVMVDHTHPGVTRVDLGGTASIDKLTVHFSEAMDQPSTASAVNYELRTLGADGKRGTKDDVIIPVRVEFKSASNQAILTTLDPLQPTKTKALAHGVLYELTVKGAVTDLVSNPLNGNAGADYRIRFGRGTAITYLDSDLDKVILTQSTGIFELFLDPDAQATLVRIKKFAPNKASVFSGSVTKATTNPAANGKATLPKIENLSKVKDLLSRTKFTIGSST